MLQKYQGSLQKNICLSLYEKRIPIKLCIYISSRLLHLILCGEDLKEFEGTTVLYAYIIKCLIVYLPG